MGESERAAGDVDRQLMRCGRLNRSPLVAAAAADWCIVGPAVEEVQVPPVVEEVEEEEVISSHSPLSS
jgi:hypothetical protein